MSEKITTQQLEKLLSDPQKRIELHKLVHEETEKVYKLIEGFSTQTTDVEGVAKKAIADFEKATEDLRLIMAYGAYFGTQDQAYLWRSTLNRLGTMPHSAGSTFLLELQLYPVLLVMYAGGISAIASDNHTSLEAILNSQVTSQAHGPLSLPSSANCTLLKQNASKLLDIEERRKTPLSDHLHQLFQKSLPNELMFGNEFDDIFDRWEIMVSMVVADTYRERASGIWAPVGRFSWKRNFADEGTIKLVKSEMEEKGKDWSPLAVGLFGSELERANNAHAVVEELVSKTEFF